ncbi:glycosyltransferase [Parasalinivibrio latis]|uniref:MJ1255/VC2487 family glycosyltransferase n=1 Tax=Parasalinivibrio latis TaxID=2952610 RepID=UPI0030DF0157
MKILYGVQGTGNGHISRARAIAKALKRHSGVDVQFLLSGREDNGYFDMEEFGNYQTRTGMTFLTESGKVSYVKTALRSAPFTLLGDIRDLDTREYDLVVSDFEPVTAWAAKQHKTPSLSISHQCAFSGNVPVEGESLISRMVMRHFAPTEKKLGLHWYHFGEDNILPPIVDLDPKTVPQSQDFYVVYLPFENLDEIVSLLTRYAQRFKVFHPAVKEEREFENVSLLRPSRDCFHQELTSCAGVMSNGGFELPSEALFLGKKLLVKPLSGQFEQMSNVITLGGMGLADCMDSLDPWVVRQWLDKQAAERLVFPDVAGIVADWLVNGDRQDFTSLWQQTWSQVRFPESVMEWIEEFEMRNEHYSSGVIPVR